MISLNTLRPSQHGRHFPDDILKCNFLNENVWISLNISLIFVPEGQIDNIPPFVQIMAWRRLSDKPLSEPMMSSYIYIYMHICVTGVNELKVWHQDDSPTDGCQMTCFVIQILIYVDTGRLWSDITLWNPWETQRVKCLLVLYCGVKLQDIMTA